MSFIYVSTLKSVICVFNVQIICFLLQNIVFDVFFICIANCLTSFVAGFAIFGTIGYLANLLEVDVANVVTSGPSLAFITYPDLV